MSLVRGVAGVFIGYAVMAFVLRFLGPGPVGSGMEYFLVSAGWTVGAALLAGFLAALIAGQRELSTASVLGLVMIAASVVSMVHQGASRPGWYETSIAGCGPMAALLGAAIRMLTKPRR